MRSKNIVRWSLNRWSDEFYARIGSAWQQNSQRSWLRFAEHATTRIAEFVREEKHAETIQELGNAFGWLCCFVRVFRDDHQDEPFRFLSDFHQMVWNKYPGACYACIHWYPEDAAALPDWLACVCLGKPPRTTNDKAIARPRLIIARDHKRQPMTLNDWSRMIRTIYGGAHKELSLSAICLHFLEEVGEVAKGLRDLHSLSPVRKLAIRKKRIQDLEEEIADVMSWMLGLLNKLDQIFEKSRQYYHDTHGMRLRAVRPSDVVGERLKGWNRSSIYEL